MCNLNLSCLVGVFFLFNTWDLLSAARRDRTSMTSHSVSLSRKLTGFGFHRVLETNLTFTEAMKFAVSNEGCRVLLLETLPPGLYADPFQVISLESFGGPRVSFYSNVDIEAAAHSSDVLKLNMFINPGDLTLRAHNKWVVSLQLPVHARYHQPHAEKTTARIEISLPRLYSSCTFSDADSNLQTSLITQCSHDDTSQCEWNFMEYIQDGDSPTVLEMDVPVGQESHRIYVVLLTIIVTLAVIGKIVMKLLSEPPFMQKKYS